jgi:hypothetical protein
MELTAHRTAASGTSSMPKALCILGTAISILLLVVFGLDLATTWPFGRLAVSMDIGVIIAAAILGYLSYATLREQG